MFIDYINAVKKEYYDKVASNSISLNLFPLTPGNIKKECKVICKHRFRRVDERVLSAFFGHVENEGNYLQTIERCDIDKFRPMINFVEGRSKETDTKNVELLAWLIDFKDRPFNSNGKYGGLYQPILVDKPRTGAGGIFNLKGHLKQLFAIKGLRSGRKPVRNAIGVGENLWLKNRILFTALIVTLCVESVGYLGLNNQVPPNIISNKDSLNGNEKVSLSQKVRTDSFKFLSNQKKIPGIYGQCRAITKKKTRCLRNAINGGFCWQHKKIGT